MAAYAAGRQAAARRALISIALAALVLAPAAAHPANCDHTAGTLVLSSIATPIGDCAQAGGADALRLLGGDVVVTAGAASPLAMTTGSITVDGATLWMRGPVKIAWSGAASSDAHLHVKSGALVMEGYEVYRGRLAAEPTWSEGGGVETATLTVDMPLPSSWAPTTETGYWVRFLADDPEDPIEAVELPVQIGPGAPAPGHYRWSAAKWTWWPITAIAGDTITISTDAYGDVEGGSDADVYAGTRGQALSEPVPLTSLVPLAHALGTQLSVATSDLDVGDSDLADQYVEFVTGPCAGWRARVTDTRDGDAQDDAITIEGDASHCDASSSVRINFGFRAGDRLQIIAAPELDGANAANLRWSGGRVQMRFANLEHLDDSEGAQWVSPGVAVQCNVCIHQRSAAQAPDFASSHVVDSRFAFANQGGAPDTGLLSFDSLDPTSASFRYPASGGMDAQWMPVERNHFVDQWNNGSGGSCPGTCAGVHSLRSEGTRNLLLVGNRITRMGDDALYATLDSLDTDVPQILTARHLIVEAIHPTSSNSAQGFNVSVALMRDADRGEELLLHRSHLQDALLVGIADGAIDSAAFGSSYERIAAAGTTTVTSIALGKVHGTWPAPAQGLSASLPNELRDTIYALRGGPGNANRLLLAGNLRDSVVYGNDRAIGTVANLRNVAGLFRSFLDLSGGSLAPPHFFDRQSNDYPPWQVPAITLEDVALLGGRNSAGGAGNGFVKLCDDVDGGGAPSDLAIQRAFFGIRTNVAPGGFLEDCITASDGAQTATISGMTLTVASTAGPRGLGCGSPPGGALCAGTDEGARVSNARVEAAGIDPTDARAFGARVTPTSSHVAALGPDVSDAAALLSSFADPARADMPRRLGLAKLGTEQAMLGDAFLASLDHFTTRDDLLDPAQASAGSFEQIFPARLGRDDAAEFSVHKFDPALGTLVGVRFTLASSFQGRVRFWGAHGAGYFHIHPRDFAEAAITGVATPPRLVVHHVRPRKGCHAGANGVREVSCTLTSSGARSDSALVTGDALTSYVGPGRFPVRVTHQDRSAYDGRFAPRLGGAPYTGMLYDASFDSDLTLTVRYEFAPSCSDGIDNDGDGAIDHPADPGCFSAALRTESPRCQNGLDDDGDGAIDFDGGAAAHGGVALASADPHCTQAFSQTERAGACGIGAELVLLLAPCFAAGARARTPAGGGRRRCPWRAASP